MMTSPSLPQLGRLAGRLLIASLQRAGTLLQYAAAHPIALPLPRRTKDCACGGCGCEIPEQACPTRCTGPISLAAMTGQKVVAGVRVINEAGEQRHFDFSSTPFLSGTSSAHFDFAPPSLDIAPGQSGFTAATVTVPTDFSQGHYQADIISRGAYEQCVLVDLEVGCEQMRSATTEIVQVEEPLRITAHCWYHHFQCAEPCGPLKRPTNQPSTVPTTTVVGVRQ